MSIFNDVEKMDYLKRVYIVAIEHEAEKEKRRRKSLREAVELWPIIQAKIESWLRHDHDPLVIARSSQVRGKTVLNNA
jgi:hypothetical protein